MHIAELDTGYLYGKIGLGINNKTKEIAIGILNNEV